MYSKRFILDVLDEHKNSLSGGSDNPTLNVPFGTEYKVFLKNDNDFDCAVDITVDGIHPLGYDGGKPNLLIIPAQSKYLLDGWFNKNLHGGDRFKLIAVDSSEAKSSGRVVGDSDNGVIEATFYAASKPADPYASLKNEWDGRLRDHANLMRRLKDLEDEAERLRLLDRIKNLEEEIERHRRKDRWNPWKDSWDKFPPYQPIWCSSIQDSTSENFTLYRGISGSSSNISKEKSILRASSFSLNKTSEPQSTKGFNSSEFEEAVTGRGSRHGEKLNKVHYEVGETPITTIQIKLVGFHPQTSSVEITKRVMSQFAPPEPSDVRFCTKCGHHLGTHNFQFCPMCGNAIPIKK